MNNSSSLLQICASMQNTSQQVDRLLAEMMGTLNQESTSSKLMKATRELTEHKNTTCRCGDEGQYWENVDEVLCDVCWDDECHFRTDVEAEYQYIQEMKRTYC